jgi:regulator of sigma E protease
MSPRLKRALVVTAGVLLWIFVDISRVLFPAAGLIWLLHGAASRVLRVRGIKAFRARYEADALASPKRKRLALRLASPALFFLIAFLFWTMALLQSETDTSEVLVESGFPAQQAGMQSGDRIVSIDGTPVSTFMEVFEHVSAAPAGAPLSLEIKRGDALHLLKVHRNEEGRIGIRSASKTVATTPVEALRRALFATVSAPWHLARFFLSDTRPERMLVSPTELTQAGGPNSAPLLLVGIGGTLAPLWPLFLVLGLVLFYLGERTVPPAPPSP